MSLNRTGKSANLNREMSPKLLCNKGDRKGGHPVPLTRHHGTYHWKNLAVSW